MASLSKKSGSVVSGIGKKGTAKAIAGAARAAIGKGKAARAMAGFKKAMTSKKVNVPGARAAYTGNKRKKK